MWLLILAFLPGSGDRTPLQYTLKTEAVFCRQCFNYNGLVCVNVQDCIGNYCLLEEITQYTGIRTVRKTCISQPYFQYPDGTYQTQLNDCSVRNTNDAQYIVKICNDQNYCNDACNSNLLPTLPPIYPPTTFPPIIPGHVQCFNCETTDGTDCRDNLCSGAYCLYERKITGNQMRIKKSCLQVAEIQLDDGTDIQTTNICEVRNTYQSQYFIKMCNDQDFCNGYCNPQDPVTNPPQRQPLVTCTCDEPQCVNGQCQANYCFFQRESRNGQQIKTRRGCSQFPYVLYPDNTYSAQTNQCESKLINDIDYQVLVCNNVNFCNTECSLVPSGKTVVCTQCEANDVSDCTGGTCTGTNCLYEKQISQTTGKSLIKKSCIISDVVTYPDGSLYSNYGACETKTVQGVEYTYQLCNASNYCNNACIGSQYTTTYSPSQSSTGLGVLLTIGLCVLAQLIMIVFILFGLICFYVISFYKNVKKYPRGPMPLPLVGNLHQIDFKNIHLDLAELSKTYGNIFTVWLPRPFVIIADCESIKEALSKDDFSGRTGVITDEIFYVTENGGIVFSQGENWKEQRRFSLHVLRDFGMGKAIMEDMVTNSVQDCLDHLKSLDTAKGVDLRWPLQLFVGNIITRVLFNFSFKYDNCEQLKEFVRAGDEELQKIKDLNPLVMLLVQTWPSLCRISFIKNLLFGSHFKVLERYYAVVQEKMRAEIANVVGFSRTPSMNDKQRLPYVVASIHEIQRMANLLPLNLTHRTVKETAVGRIPIPEDTFVITLLSNVLLNSSQDGDVFKPERFLLEDGITLNKEAVDKNIVFSTGKRTCAGEGLARVELFVGIVAILQNYKILPMPGKQVDLSPVISFSLQPQRQLLRLVPLTE